MTKTAAYVSKRNPSDLSKCFFLCQKSFACGIGMEMIAMESVLF